MKKILKSLTIHIFSLLLAIWILSVYAVTFPTSSPSWETYWWLFMNYINKILVNNNILTTDWTVKKAAKLVNNISDCWTGKWLQWFNSNWDRICALIWWSPSTINWLCWSSNLTTTPSYPTTWLCDKGNKVDVDTIWNDWTFNWRCDWSWWWTNASCSATKCTSSSFSSCSNSSTPNTLVYFVRNWNEWWEFTFSPVTTCFSPISSCSYSWWSYLNYWSCTWTWTVTKYYKAWRIDICTSAYFDCINWQLQRNSQAWAWIQPLSWVKLFNENISCLNFKNY